MTQVAVVILNYNGRNFLEKFLPSVISHSNSAKIYVADSSSTDDSMFWLSENYPNIALIKLDKNYGYAGGYNRALKVINAKYYVLLNSDVEVTPNWLNPMLDLLENNHSIAACQPKILSYEIKNQFEYAGAAGGFIDWMGFTYCRGRIFYDSEIDTGQYNTTIPIFWASGACLFIRSAIFHKVGGFDEDFFAHFEEIDLCWRIHLWGHQVYCCPDSTIYHVGGGTLPPTNSFKTFLNHRNSLTMLYKNLPPSHLLLNILWRLIADGISALRFLPSGQFSNIWAVIRAHFIFYKWAFSILPKKRKEIWKNEAFFVEPNSLPISRKSIIMAYFINGCKTYNSLPRN